MGKGLDPYVVVDSSGTLSEAKRQVGLLADASSRRHCLGLCDVDGGNLEKDNARPEAGEVYGAMDMPWAKLVGQIAEAYGK